MIRSCPIHDGYTDDALRPFGWSSGLYSFRCRDCRNARSARSARSAAAPARSPPLRKAEAYPPSAEQASAPVTRFAVRTP